MPPSPSEATIDLLETVNFDRNDAVQHSQERSRTRANLVFSLPAAMQLVAEAGQQNLDLTG